MLVIYPSGFLDQTMSVNCPTGTAEKWYFWGDPTLRIYGSKLSLLNPAHGSWVERNGIGESRPLWVSMLGDFEVHICGSVSMLVCWPLEFFGRCTSMLVSKSLCRKHKSKKTMSYNVHVNHFMLRIDTWLTQNSLTWTSSWDVQKTCVVSMLMQNYQEKNANIDMERDFYWVH